MACVLTFNPKSSECGHCGVFDSCYSKYLENQLAEAVRDKDHEFRRADDMGNRWKSAEAENERLKAALADMTRQRDEHAHNLRCAVDEVERMRQHARACAESMFEAVDKVKELRRHLGEVMRVRDELGNENRRLMREIDDMRRERDRAVEKHESATKLINQMIAHGARPILDYSDDELMRSWPAKCQSLRCNWRGLAESSVRDSGCLICPKCGWDIEEDRYVSRDYRKVRNVHQA